MSRELIPIGGLCLILPLGPMGHIFTEVGILLYHWNFHRKHPCLTVKDKGFPVQKTWQEQIRSGACPIGGRQERWVDWAPWNKGPYIALHPFHHLPSPNLWIILGETSLFQMLVYIIYLVGGLEHDFFDFPIILGMENHPNWRTPSFFRGVRLKPPTRYI
jgi:hypothetical protein